MEILPNGYPVFKALQKPLEFMGIRGRFLYYIAGAIGIGFLGYVVCSILIGQVIAIVVLALVAVGGYLYSLFAQKKGLHSKKKSKDILMVKTLFSR